MQPNQRRSELQTTLSSLAGHSTRQGLHYTVSCACVLYSPPLVGGLQAEFNTSFKAAQDSRQAEVDRILDANNRMKEIWEEQARAGSGSGAGAGEAALFQPQGAFDDTEDSVLSVKVKLLSSFTPPLPSPPPPTLAPHCVSFYSPSPSLLFQRYEWL